MFLLSTKPTAPNQKSPRSLDLCPSAGVENTIDNLCKEVHNISEKLAEKTHSAESNPQSIHEVYKNGKLIKVYKNYRNTRGYNLQMNGFLHFMFEYF